MKSPASRGPAHSSALNGIFGRGGEARHLRQSRRPPPQREARSVWPKSPPPRRVQLVGDDFLVTNPAVIAGAIERKAGNAALIKVNQIGTVTETLDAMRICRQAGWAQMVSHRSGETEDSFIADLAVGSGCGQLKSGAPARGERVVKYDRLIEIEAAEKLPYGLCRPIGRRR